MKAKIKEMQTELQNSGKIPCFEMPVIDKRTNEREYIVFDVFFRKNSLIAQHEALNRKESKSKKIACKKIIVDTDFSLDSNLENLFSECAQGILDSEFFELAE